MRTARLWKDLLGVERTVVESVELEGEGGNQILVAKTRPDRGRRSRCAKCGRRCPGYDQGDGPRRWRTLDFGTHMAYIEAESPRVRCPEHGVVVAAVPWARPGARCTMSFEDQCAWLTAQASATAVAELLRTTWRTVTGIVERVVADLAGRTDLLEGLTRIGIDEIAHRKGQRYITCVVDHGTGRLVWAMEGRNHEVVGQFFDALGEARTKALTHVSADGADWIHTVVKERAPKAKICLDAFHLVAWATKALDEVRREMWQASRATGRAANATSVKGSRWALLKSPQKQTPEQRGTVATIAKTNKRLYRAYLLREQLRAAVAAKGKKGRELLAGWIWWAEHSRLPAFVKLAETVKRLRPYILNMLAHGPSNARSEATNTHLRVLTRRAYGFHSPEALIAMAMLTRGGLCPKLPGRA